MVSPLLRPPPRTGRPTGSRRRAALLGCLALGLALACDQSKGTAPGSLDEIVIDRTADSVLFVGESVDLRAVALDASRREMVDLTQSITWESENEDVVSVEAATGVVVARGPGTAKVRAQVQGQTAEITFRVSYQIATVEAVIQGPDSVRVRDDVQVCAVARSGDGVEVGDGDVTWASSDADVLSLLPTVARCATFRGEKKGLALVSAEIAGKRGEAPVKVVARVSALTVEDLPATLVAGDCVTLDVVPRDENGARLGRAVGYRSSDESVATVEADAGRACWEAEGTATITAESEGVSRELAARVVPAPLTVVGYADLASDTRRAFRWTEADGLEQIPFLPGATSALAKGVNDNGQIVGETETGSGVLHAFIYTPGRGIRELPAPPGATGAEAKAINNNGQVAGSAFYPDGTQRLTIWTVAGDAIEVFDRGTAPEARRSNVEGLNLTGTIAGNGIDETGRMRAYRATAGGSYNYLSVAIDERSSEAKGINDAGDIAGFYVDADGLKRPFLATGGSVKQPLEIPLGCREAMAYGIDDAGRSVVTAQGCANGDRTFLRSQNGTYSPLFGANTQARAMNEHGDVVGWTIVGGLNQAYYWRRGASAGTLLGRFGAGQRSNALAVNAVR
jgi:probable HAF family extracellular repeat protein